MKVNVSHRVEAKDGGKFVTLLVKNNPHEVSDEVGKILIKQGSATAVVVAAPVVVPEIKPEGDDIDLNAKTVTELRAMAKDMEITGASEMTKAVLIQAIEDATGEAE